MISATDPRAIPASHAGGASLPRRNSAVHGRYRDKRLGRTIPHTLLSAALAVALGAPEETLATYPVNSVTIDAVRAALKRLNYEPSSPAS
jgi:hypothetical protein